MKGKQLSLQEVLKLEDGSKVWVEELNTRYSDWSGIHKRVLDELIAEKDEMVYELKYLDDLGEDYGIEIYEWIDSDSTLIYNLATEICNLRSLDLTDENIEMIIKEFSWQCKLDEL